PDEHRLVRALRDDRNRTVRAGDRAYPEREQRVEERPVEQREPADEPEDAVLARSAVGGSGEDADVEAFLQSGELPLEAGRERQLVARTCDKEDVRPH